MKLFRIALSILILTGCTQGPRLDTSHPSTNFDSRVQFVILHYTSASEERSLQLLTRGEVSSHYLLGVTPPTIYKLVDEDFRAWHAGQGAWQGRTWLNSSSIGVEIVNPGYRDTPSGRIWYPYTEGQIQALIVLLKDITKRYRIDPRHIIGHSDIAPLRKYDPGPLFPWKRLANAGLAIWPDAQAVAHLQTQYSQALPGISWFQQQLAILGYETPQTGELDRSTQRVIAAFQMHYRPHRYDGLPDAETAAILQVLNQTH
jgi:N-acetylmuramoyl-L-alanine amidase